MGLSSLRLSALMGARNENLTLPCSPDAFPAGQGSIRGSR